MENSAWGQIEKYYNAWQSKKSATKVSVPGYRIRTTSYLLLSIVVLSLLKPSSVLSMGQILELDKFGAPELVPQCVSSAALTKAKKTGDNRYDYTFEGNCSSFCLNHDENDKITFKVESAYDQITQKAAEKITIEDQAKNEIGKIQTTMERCFLDPFIYGPGGASCLNRKHGAGGECFEGFTHVFSGFATAGRVPHNVTYEEVDGYSGPPAPPPLDAYKIKMIVLPEGPLSIDNMSELSVALVPFHSTYPPDRIKVHWESVIVKSDTGVSGTEITTVDSGPKAELKWTYYEKVPTDWGSFPVKVLTVPLSFFPSTGTYRLRVVALSPGGGEYYTEWSNFSIVPTSQSLQVKENGQKDSVPTMKPVPDLIVAEIHPESDEKWGSKSWQFRWTVKNVGSTDYSNKIPTRFKVACEVIKGLEAADEMCATLHDIVWSCPGGVLGPGETWKTYRTQPVTEPEGLFQIKIKAVVDPENLILEGALGEKNNELNYILSSNILQKKTDYQLQVKVSNTIEEKKSKYPSMGKQMKKVGVAAKPKEFAKKTVVQARMYIKNKPATIGVYPKNPVAGLNKSFRLSKIKIRNKGDGQGKQYKLKVKCTNPKGKKCGENYKNVTVPNLAPSTETSISLGSFSAKVPGKYKITLYLVPPPLKVSLSMAKKGFKPIRTLTWTKEVVVKPGFVKRPLKKIKQKSNKPIVKKKTISSKPKASSSSSQPSSNRPRVMPATGVGGGPSVQR